ncbi:MAG: YcxB family protein [Ruminococcus sp.]|nr:YcxB family protein [Ruminococcus sp.]
MEIKATCTFDLKSIKALAHLSMFKKANPKKSIILWTVIYAVLIAVIALELILIGYDFLLVVLLCVSAFLILYRLYMFFLVPLIRYKNLGIVKGAVNEYIFTDDLLTVKTTGKEYNSEGAFRYIVFLRVWETSEYLFIYPNKRQAYLVDKSSVSDCELELIREKLTSVDNIKYIRCNY